MRRYLLLSICLLLSASFVSNPATSVPGSHYAQKSALAVKMITVGGGNSCALLSSGKVNCWGSNHYGSLGDGTLTNRLTPVEVIDLDNVAQVSSGDYQYGVVSKTCAVLFSGRVKCWGRDEIGPSTTFPKVVDNLTNALAVSTSIRQTCAITTTSQVFCWGKGPFGDGTRPDDGNILNASRTSPTSPVVGLNDPIQVSAGGSTASCAVERMGQVKCWGWDQLDVPITAKTVAGVEGATQVSAGLFHTCAVLVNGKVKCWGNNNWGQLGDGTRAIRNQPVEVLNISNAIQVSAGQYGTCALLETARVKCWGSTLTEPVLIEEVPGITNAKQVAFSWHGCALLTKNIVKCWGNNSHGELGNGTIDDSEEPVEVLFPFRKPIVKSISPRPVTRGENLTIRGKNLSGARVLFGRKIARTIINTGRLLVVQVPFRASLGRNKVKITNTTGSLELVVRVNF